MRAPYSPSCARAMAAAHMYGCEADVQRADQLLFDSNHRVDLKIVVIKRSIRDELQTLEHNVRLPRNDLAKSVVRIVGNAAARLAE